LGSVAMDACRRRAMGAARGQEGGWGALAVTINLL
jgi:hypothetical protein